MAISRLTVLWSGFRGAPGYSNFFYDGAFGSQEAVQAAAVNLGDFLRSIATELPGGVTLEIQPICDILDEASGQTTGQIDFTPPAAQSGAGQNSYSAAAGAVVNWNTTSYVNGRRVRGRTFIVPLAGNRYDNNGDLTTGTLTTLRGAATALVESTADLPLCVWSRPVGGAGGSSHVISTASVPDLGAVLRSRRD